MYYLSISNIDTGETHDDDVSCLYLSSVDDSCFVDVALPTRTRAVSTGNVSVNWEPSILEGRVLHVSITVDLYVLNTSSSFHYSSLERGGHWEQRLQPTLSPLHCVHRWFDKVVNGQMCPVCDVILPRISRLSHLLFPSTVQELFEYMDQSKCDLPQQNLSI